MLSSWGRKAIISLIVVALAWLVGRAYTTSPQLTPNASPDWSKGIPLGVASVKNPVAAVVNVTGHIFLAWTDTARQLHLAELDNRGQSVQNRALDLPTRWPVQAQLRTDSSGNLYLTWLDGEGGHYRLYFALLDPSGRLRSQPIPLTPDQEDVESYAIVRNPQGKFDVFWAGKAGIYHLVFDSTGAVGDSVLLTTGGSKVVAQPDSRGRIRLVWIRETAPSSARFKVYYATYDSATGQMEEGQQVGLIFRHIRQRATGPYLGLDTSNGYVFWSVEGEERGQLYFSTFPLDDPAAYYVDEIRLPGVNFITASSTAEGQASELVAAWTVEVTSHLIRGQQVAEAHFSGGKFREMQIVNLSKSASLRPVVLRDDQRNLHMAWLDTAGFARYRVMYASTSPSVRDAFKRPNVRSLVDTTLDTLINLSLVILFIPLWFLRALAPLTFLVIYSLITYRVELSERSARWALTVAILLQILATGLIAPGMSNVTWEGLSPQTTALLIRWALPVVLAGVAMGVMFLYLHRAEARLLLPAFLVFSVTHGVLQLAFYVATYVRQAFSFDYLYIRH